MINMHFLYHLFCNHNTFSHLRLVGWDEKINFNVGVYPCSFSLSCQMVSGPFWLKIFPPAVQILVVATRAWEHGSMGSTSSTRRSPWMGRQRSWRSRSMDWRKIRRWRTGVWSSQSIWSSAPQVPHHGRHYWWQRLVIHHDGGQERRSSSLSLPSLARLWNHGELSIQHQRAHRARSSDAPQFRVPSFALCELYFGRDQGCLGGVDRFHHWFNLWWMGSTHCKGIGSSGFSAILVAYAQGD